MSPSARKCSPPRRHTPTPSLGRRCLAQTEELNFDLILKHVSHYDMKHFFEFLMAAKLKAPTHVDEFGANLLMKVILYSSQLDPVIIQHIISHPGFDISQRNFYQNNVLYYIAERKDCPLQIWRILINKGADVLNINKYGRCPLRWYLN